jgi:hypothetical protein
VQTVSGLAYGVDEPTEFDDPTAILTGAWGSSQTVMATVAVNKTPENDCCHEVELRLRTTISPHRITGYEAYCSVMPNRQYCRIARWNGPNAGPDAGSVESPSFDRKKSGGRARSCGG